MRQKTQRTDSGMHALAQLGIACECKLNLLGVCAGHFHGRRTRWHVFGMAAQVLLPSVTA